MQECDPRLMTPREIVSELASILTSGYLRHVKVRRFMDEGSPLPGVPALPALADITPRGITAQARACLMGMKMTF